VAGGDAPRGNAVEQFYADMHEAGESQAAAEPTFRIIICDAEGLENVGLRGAPDSNPELPAQGQNHGQQKKNLSIIRKKPDGY
jgi:hypothetical protein